MTTATADELREHIEALRAFRAAYVAYLEGGPDGGRDLRQAVIKAIPAAQDAMNTMGGGLAVGSPPMTGSPMVYRGLENVAFLHEQPDFASASRPCTRR